MNFAYKSHGTCLVILLVATLPATWARAQDHGAHRPASRSEPAHEEHAGSASGDEHARMMGAMTGPLGIPLQQNASGTAWQPASTPMYGHMAHHGDWTFMLHYLAFAGLDVQRSDRGETEGFTTNWVMAMAQHPLVGGELTARAMLSLEPAFLGTNGYALLLQTGETSGGEPLVDRQHPHDLFMEVALKYNRPLTDGLAFELYVAPSGEPALGPPGFPHRVSAYADAMAPLSHHWQDSTHILFGVLTGGLYTRRVKLEASWFNGREPGEYRYDIDLRVPDSYSARLALNPTADWSGQVSYGFLREPEFILEPDEDLHRLTASITHDRRLANQGNWATTAAWGQNRSEHGDPSDAFLVESVVLVGGNNIFGRAEYVVKSGHDFALEGPAEEDTFPVGALALGYLRDLGSWQGLVPGIGARAAINVVGEDLEDRYGTRYPLGFVVYARLRPAEMMSGMQH